MNQARMNPDGFVPQRFEADFNGHGHWLLMHLVEGNLTANVLTDDDVKDWPALAPVRSLTNDELGDPWVRWTERVAAYLTETHR